MRRRAWLRRARRGLPYRRPCSWREAWRRWPGNRLSAARSSSCVRPWPASACSRSIRTSGPAKGPRPSGYSYSSDSPRGECGARETRIRALALPEARATVGGEAVVRSGPAGTRVPSPLAKRLAARDASGGEQNAHAQTARLDGFHGVVGAGRVESADAHEEGSMQRLVHTDDEGWRWLSGASPGIGKS